MNQLTTKQSQEIARPLSALVPLIKEDLEEGDRAGMEFYRAAGEKLSEARAHFDRLVDLYAWAEKKFGKSQVQLRTYMALAAASSDKSFKSIADFKRTENYSPSSARESGRVYRDWTAPVDSVVQKARVEANAEAYRIAHESRVSNTQALNQEREAEKKLALRLIDIGYKVLARELHPDKGGSRDAMARLNRVRVRLKECAGGNS